MADCVNTDYHQLEAGLLLEYQFLSPGVSTRLFRIFQPLCWMTQLVDANISSQNICWLTDEMGHTVYLELRHMLELMNLMTDAV